MRALYVMFMAMLVMAIATSVVSAQQSAAAISAPATAATPTVIAPATAAAPAAAVPAEAPPATAEPVTSTPPVSSLQGILDAARKLAAEKGKKPGDPKAAQPAKANPAEAAQKQAEEQKRQMRLQRLQQTPFDRRPSAILKAWAEDPAKKVAETPTTPGKPTPPKDEIQEEITKFQRAVTLGQWDEVKKYLASLPEADAKSVYQHLLQVLANAQQQQGQPQQAQIMQMGNGMFGNMAMQQQQADPRAINETPSFRFQDVIGLAEASPTEPDAAVVAPLGRILVIATKSGNDIVSFMEQARAHIDGPGEGKRFNQRLAARILDSAGESVRAIAFLPAIDEARDKKDVEGLNLLASHFMAMNAKEGKLEDIEKAWQATQSALGIDEAKPEEKQKSLRRAVELAPRVRKELGQQWLDDSFTTHAERGKDLLASIGSFASQSRQNQANNAAERLNTLKFQSTVTETLLQKTPDLATEWSAPLSILAQNWLREAELSFRLDTSSQSGPNMQRDIYGNIFYSSDPDQEMRRMNQGGFAPISIRDVLKVRPSDAWLLRIDPALRPSLSEILAKLHLKIHKEDDAFPFIREVATKDPARGKQLAEEFVRIWTESHDPNKAKNKRNPYIWFFGFEQRADGIPLTRSKQERNLKELAILVQRLKELNVGEINQSLLTGAFMSSHSSAEVYRLETIEEVFGSIDGLKPRTLAALLQRMRGNLATVWRMPAEQEKNKTNRRQKDIEAEVRRGYEVAMAVTDKATKEHPEDWSLQLAKATLLHDRNDYEQELSRSTDYAATRRAALDEFHKAAKLYVAGVDKMPENERTTEPFDIWFYASLGACDLGQVNEEKRPALEQFKLIRETMKSLPGETAEWHMASFANSLFTRMSSAKPVIKVRYLKAGFEIVGDHERAAEAKDVLNYYNDIVTEIKLETVIDGSDVVGHGKPFGVFVNMKHTKEIERESGGFKKYLQNQNSGQNYYYNYGRPLEDYRDKFQNAATQALDEQFEVLSITFNHEDTTSKSAKEDGWRVTPYCYILLKAKGPEVDKLPQLQLDLDFLDTSGFAVIPISSAAIPIDARPDKSTARPAGNIKVTQTLDERQAKDGKLILEVKATADGLVPALDDLVTLAPAGFEVAKMEDRGVSVVEFAKEAGDTRVSSERLWQIEFKTAANATLAPKEFTFALPQDDENQMTYQRYDDADLVPAAQLISLEKTYKVTNYQRFVWLAAAIVGVAALFFAAWRFLRRQRPTVSRGIAIPDPLTPFTLLGFLRQIDTASGLSTDHRMSLATTIEKIERYYFADSVGEAPDLRSIAETWGRYHRQDASAS